MIDILLQGYVDCDCGNTYYFNSILETTVCMKCGKTHPNNGEPIPEPTEEELTEPENE
jgi:hypothetical protein